MLDWRARLEVIQVLWNMVSTILAPHCFGGTLRDAGILQKRRWASRSHYKGNLSQRFPTSLTFLFRLPHTRLSNRKASHREEDPTCHLSQHDLGHHIMLCRRPQSGLSVPKVALKTTCTLLSPFATSAMTTLAACESDPSSEATPLLRPAVRSSGRTPLPIRQLLVLACIRLAEPVNFTLIFPFINEVLPFKASRSPVF